MKVFQNRNKFQAKNCLICYNFKNYVEICGVFPFDIRHKHGPSYPRNFKVELSTKGKILFGLIACLVIIALIGYFHYLPTIDFNDKHFLVFLSDVFLFAYAILTALVYFVTIEKRCGTVYLFLYAAIDPDHLFGEKSIISGKSIDELNRFVKRLKMFVLIFGPMAVSNCICFLIFPSFEAFRKFTISLSAYLVISLMYKLRLSFVADTLLYSEAKETFMKDVKPIFDERDDFIKVTCDNFSQKVDQFKRFHEFFVNQYTKIGEATTLQNLQYIFFLVMNFVFNIWLLIKLNAYNEFLNLEYVAICRMIATVGMWTIDLFNSIEQEKLTSLVRDILSYLYLYPISKLNCEEASQMELLIKTLNTKSPTIRASDILTTGNRLHVSVTGTVITYVLVALQFHMSVAKE